MKVLIAAIASCLAVAAQASAQIVEMNGTWELNPKRSLDERGPDSESLIFKNSDVEQRYTMEYENEDGEKGQLHWAVKCDGKDHPSPPAPWTDAPGRTVSLTKLGARSVLVTHKKDGVLTNTYTRVQVDDDNTLISIGRDSDGNVEWVRIFDRQ